MATMRLRWIHSCMVLTVVGLLLVYSAFLTSPSYVDSVVDGGETTGGYGINSTLIQNKLLANAIADVSFALTDSLPQLPQLQLVNVSNGPSVGRFPSAPKQETHNLAEFSLVQANTIPQIGQPVSKRSELKPYSSNKETVWTRDIYESGFAYPNPSVCVDDGQNIKLVIIISSAPGHFSSRDAIRLTWGHYSQRLDVAMAFIVGKTENETILQGIETEKHLYDDLIVANFMDSYDNLTLKTMSSLEWVDTYCNQSEYVLKTDDDMFINVPNLLNFIKKIQVEDQKQPKLYGRLARKWKPVRNKKSKYYISFKQYRKTVYPDFTTGPAYLFRTRLVRPLFEKGMEKTYLKLEDVYTSGILAQELNIKRTNIPEFANKKVNFHKTGFCALSRLISMHMVAYHEQFELWKKILDGRTKCKIIYTNVAKNKVSPSSVAPHPPHPQPVVNANSNVESSVSVTNSSSTSSVSSSSSSSAATTNNNASASGADRK